MAISINDQDGLRRHRPFARLKKFITSYPTLFGMLMGLIGVVGIIVIVDWFPRVDDAWERNNKAVRSVFFTVGFFATLIFRFSSWRRRNVFVFWGYISTFFLFHTIGILFYSNRVHQLSLGEWVVLMSLESFVFVFGLDWSTRRFWLLGHSDSS